MRSTAAARSTFNLLVQFNLLTEFVSGDMRDDSAEILFQSFLKEALVSSTYMGRDVYFDVVHPAFPLPTTASPTPHPDTSRSRVAL